MWEEVEQAGPEGAAGLWIQGLVFPTQPGNQRDPYWCVYLRLLVLKDILKDLHTLTFITKNFRFYI